MEYYLKFTIADIGFAVSINEVREIVRPHSISSPEKPVKYLIGHFPLRGVQMPVFDLPFFLEIEMREAGEIIVAVIDEFLVGFKVHRVLGIVQVERLLSFPEFIKPKDFLKGVIQDQDSFLQVLSFRKLLTAIRSPVFRSVRS